LVGRISDAVAQPIDSGAILRTIGGVTEPGRAVKERLLRTLKAVRDFGREQVKGELGRQ
jgi:hypothetical protein